MAKLIPEVNSWYQDVEEDEIFEVVAVDDQEGYIEVQYLSGEIGEFDMETWREMLIITAQPPEDWRAPFEISDDEDVFPGGAFNVSNWDDPHANIDSEAFPSLDDF
jgi:hypothetical protein